MENDHESEPLPGIQEGFPPERAGGVAEPEGAPKRGAWEIEVDGRLLAFHDARPTGREIRETAGAIPADEFILIRVVNRETRSVPLDERVDLQEAGRPQFRVFHDDRIFTFTLDGRGFEWGSDAIPAAELRAYAEIPAHFELVLGHETGAVIPDDSEIALSELHAALRLFTRPRQPEVVTIIVNGRPRQVKGPKVSFDQIVALAFPTPPPGTDVQFTVQYMRGPGHKPSGTLIEGQSVKIRSGMEFDVTPTNRS